jgi:osmotically-inducible protein OsmY
LLTVTVDGDVVTLSGTVRSRADHETALTAAAAAPGVTDVHDHVHVAG